MSRLKRVVVTALLLSLLPSCAWAADRQAWHRYMRDGNFATNIQNFVVADELFKKAFDVAQDIGKEEQWLSIMCRGSLAEDLGKYEVAEKYYSQALELSDDYEVAYCLINVLDKEKKNDEAAGLRKRFKYRTEEQHKSENSSMPVVKSDIQKEWRERLPQAPDFHKIEAFATLGAWTRVYIYVHSALKHPVAYVRDSSGDEKIDAASIDAAESLDVRKIASKFSHGTIIEFTFDYMVKRPEGIPHAMHPRSEHRYREYRNLLTWQQKHLGPDHPEVAINLTSAAALLKESSNNTQAEVALAKAWEIWQANGMRCGGTFSTLQAYGEILLKNHKEEAAVAIFRQATAIADELFGPTSKISLDSKRELIKALKKVGHSSEAKEIEVQLKQVSST